MVCYLDLIGFHRIICGFNSGTLLGLNRMSWYFTWISKDLKVFYLD